MPQFVYNAIQENTCIFMKVRGKHTVTMYDQVVWEFIDVAILKEHGRV